MPVYDAVMLPEGKLQRLQAPEIGSRRGAGVVRRRDIILGPAATRIGGNAVRTSLRLRLSCLYLCWKLLQSDNDPLLWPSGQLFIGSGVCVGSGARGWGTRLSRPEPCGIFPDQDRSRLLPWQGRVVPLTAGRPAASVGKGVVTQRVRSAVWKVTLRTL